MHGKAERSRMRSLNAVFTFQLGASTEYFSRTSFPVTKSLKSGPERRRGVHDRVRVNGEAS
eukprot:366000-Chlamydomonas_euryale.AAC.74